MWDSRVPRDLDGRIVLNKSPVILKHLVHRKLKASMNIPGNVMSSPTPLAADQLSYLAHISRFLTRQSPPHGLKTKGCYSLFKKNELDLLSVHLQSWCSGDLDCLELIYQGSRSGLDAKVFHECCTGESSSTKALVKVRHDGIGSGSSVIGGFWSVS